MTKQDLILAGADYDAQMRDVATIEAHTSKIDLLQKKKQEKLDSLSTKVGPSLSEANISNYADTGYTGTAVKHGRTVQTTGVHDFDNQQEEFSRLINEHMVYDGGFLNEGTSLNLDPSKKYKEVAPGQFTEFTGKTRNAYIRNLGIDPVTGDQLQKFGVARNDLTDEAIAKGITPEQARYMDKRGSNVYKGSGGQYDGTPGPLGEAEGKALFDAEFDHDALTEFELKRYMDRSTIAARAMGLGEDTRYKDFGSGGSEYTLDSRDPLFNVNAPKFEGELPKGTVTPTVPQGYTKEGTRKDTGSTGKSSVLSFMEAIRNRESSGNYKAVNKGGYIGAYQFGAARLQDLGVVKPGTSNKDLDNPEVWTGKYGFDSKDKFLSDPMAQEKLARDHFVDLQKHFQGTATDQADLFGKMAAAHLLGKTGAKDLTKTDALGTSGEEYYRLGSSAVRGTGTDMESRIEAEIARINASADARRKEEGATLLGLTVNAAKSAGSTLGGLAADMVDSLFDLGAKAGETVYESVAGKEVTQEDLKNLEKIGFRVDPDGNVRHYWSWEKYDIGSKQAFDKLLGTERRVADEAMKNFQDDAEAALNSDAPWYDKVGAVVVSMAKNAEAIPIGVADSFAFLTALRKAPLQMLIADVNQVAEERFKETGEATNIETIAKIVPISAIKLGADYIVDSMTFGVGKLGGINKALVDKAFKLAPKGLQETFAARLLNGVAKKASQVALAGAQEFPTEALQEALHIVSVNLDRDGYSMENVWGILEPEAQEAIRRAGWSGLQIGMGQSAVGQAASGVLSTGANTIVDRMKKDVSKTPVVEPAVEVPLTEAERKTIGKTLTAAMSGSVQEHAKALLEIEGLVGKLDPVNNPKHAVAVRDYESLMEKIRKDVETMDASKPLVFGSSEEAEAVISSVLEQLGKRKEAVGEELDSKLVAIAKANNISTERYNKIRTAAAVEYEASEGKRGYLSYQRELAALRSSDNPDQKKIRAVVKNATRLYESQERYFDALEAAIAEANAIATAANKSGVLEKRKVKVNVPTTKWTVAIVGKEKGQYKVDSNSLTLLENKRKNIVGARAALELVEEYGGSKGATESYTVPEYAGKKGTAVEKMYKLASAYVKKQGINKVVSAKDTTKYGSTYTSAKSFNKDGMNNSYINSGTYSEKDTVLVTGALFKADNAKTTKRSKVQQASDVKLFNEQMLPEIKKAIKAGATIVIDPAMGTVEKALVKKALRIGSGKGEKRVSYVATINEEGKRSLRYVRSDKVEEANADTKKKIEAKKKREAVRDAVILKTAELLVAETSEVDIKKELENLDGVVDVFSARDDVTSGDKAFSHAVRKLDEQIKTITDKAMLDGALVNISNINNIAQEVGISSKAIKELALRKLKELREASATVDDILEQWRENLDIIQSGEADTDTIKEAYERIMKDIKEYGTPLENVLKESSTAGMPDAYTFMQDGKVKVVFSKEALDKRAATETITGVRTVTPDVTRVLKISKEADIRTSPLAVINPGFLGFRFQQLTKSTTEKLEELFKLKKDDAYATVNSPGRGLLFNKDGEVNPNVALVMATVLRETLKVDGYMLSDKYKSAQDLANMLGTDEFSISREAMETLRDKGMLLKTLSNSMGKSFMSVMGLTRSNDNTVDGQMYDSLVADIGNMIVLLGVKEGILVQDRIPATEYARLLGLDTKTEAKGADVLFMKLKSGKEDDVADMVEEFDAIEEVLPDVSTKRVEPLYRRLSQTHIDKLKVIRKDKALMEVPEKSKKAIDKLSKIEWKFDIKLARELVGTEDKINATLKHLGYRELEDMKDASYEKQSVQEAINRDAVKSVDEILRVVNKFEGKDSVKMYFGWSFIKNGRYMLNSNTINPQTDKLHRFLVQPTNTTLLYNKGEITGDRLFKVKYALSQAFGLKVDKDMTKKIDEWGDALLGMTSKQIKELEDAIWAGESYKLGDLKLEGEHLSHSLQAIDFMRKRLEKETFYSNLTAEFDAVTSGFGNKMAQMGGLVKNWREHALKVGVVSKKVLDAAKVWDGKSKLKGVLEGFNVKTVKALQTFDPETMNVNDLFGAGMPDSYQTLAIDMVGAEDITLNTLVNNLEGKTPITTTKAHEKLWNVLKNAEALPKVLSDEVVSKSMRNLFKYPFMIFNYSASMRTLRRNMVHELIHTVVDTVLEQHTEGKLEPKNEELLKQLTKHFNTDTESLVDAFKTSPLKDIRVSENSKENMYTVLEMLLQGSYGSKFETVMSKKFGPFMELQDATNTMFKIMFEAYKVKFNEKLGELRKLNNGAISDEQYKNMILELRNEFPAINGPLTEEGDNAALVAIYSEKSTSVYGDVAGQYGVTTRINPTKLDGSREVSSMNVSHKVKQFEAAVNAGSVVPYHFIDGAHLTSAIMMLQDAMGATFIHDAIMPDLDNAVDMMQTYNKAYFDNNTSYSMVEEIFKSLERLTADMDWEKVKDVTVGYGANEMTLEEKYAETMAYMKKTLPALKSWRKEFAEEMREGGWIGHLVGVPGGMYYTGEGSKGTVNADQASTKEKDGTISTVDKVQALIAPWAVIPKEVVVLLEGRTFTDNEIAEIVESINCRVE